MSSQVWRMGTTGEQVPGAAAHEGDVHGFNELVRVHQEMVYNSAYRLLGDAEEAANVTQHAFLAAYKARIRLQSGSFKLGVLRLVADACYDRLCAADSQGPEGDQVARLRYAVDEPHVDRGQADADQRLQAGILALPAEERIVLVLSDVSGLSYGDIGRITGLPHSTVSSRLNHARVRLRDYVLNIH
jgi:RNA polymerase sigma-70 factor, ECF subfamily